MDEGLESPFPWPTFSVTPLSDGYKKVVLFDRGTARAQCLFHEKKFVGFQNPGANDTTTINASNFIPTTEQPHPPTQPDPDTDKYDAWIDWMGTPKFVIRLSLGEKDVVKYDFEPITGGYEYLETMVQMVMDKHTYPPFSWMTTGLRLWLVSPQRHWFLYNNPDNTPLYPRVYQGYNDDGDLVNDGQYGDHSKKTVVVLNKLNRIVITPNRLSLTLVHQDIWMFMETKIQDGVLEKTYFGAYASNNVTSLDVFGGESAEEPVHQLEELWPQVKNQRQHASYGVFPVEPNRTPWVFSLNSFVPMLKHQIDLVVNPDTWSVRFQGEKPSYSWIMKQELERDPTQQPTLDQVLAPLLTFDSVSRGQKRANPVKVVDLHDAAATTITTQKKRKIQV